MLWTKANMVHIKNVEEIIKISESHESPNLLACKYIRKNVDNMIRSRAINHKDVSFEIPAMIVSNPHYDRARVTKKISSHYTKIGFNCEIEDYTIRISWYSEEKVEESEEESNEDLEEDSDDCSTNSDENQEPKKVVLANDSLHIRIKDLQKK